MNQSPNVLTYLPEPAKKVDIFRTNGDGPYPGAFLAACYRGIRYYNCSEITE